MEIALIGAGAMAARHAAAIQRSTSARLAVVVDRDPRRAASLACEHGVPWGAELSDAATADGAIVATSTAHHVMAAGTLLELGLGVLVEKPVDTDLAATEALVRTADRSDSVLMCGFVERFNPTAAALAGSARQPGCRIRTERIGPPPRTVDSSVIDDLLIHDLDLLVRHAPTRTLRSVTAEGSDVNGDWFDTVHCELSFDDGTVASMLASRRSSTRRRRHSVTSNATTVEADLLAPAGHPLVAQIEHFAHLLLEGTGSSRQIERASILPAHRLAAAVSSSIGAPCGP